MSGRSVRSGEGSRSLMLTSDEAAAVSGEVDPSRIPLTATWSTEELAAMEELREAGTELEATYRAHQSAKERHQQALGKLHRIWEKRAG